MFQRDAQDRYADPGRFLTVRDARGQTRLRLDDDAAWLIGEDYSADGQFPFVDRIDLTDGITQRVYQSTLRDRAENIVELSGTTSNLALVQIESPSEAPDYLPRAESPRQLAHFGTPYPSLREVHKQVLDDRRADGLALSGVLYLPAGHNDAGTGALPLRP